MTAPQTLHQSDLRSLPLRARGKVRDIYYIDADHMLIVTTDRISAFDCIMPNGIPRKGEVLTRISAYWFDRTAAVVPNHMIEVLDASNAATYGIDDEALFVNTMRREYCGNKDLNGIHFYLTGVSSESVHVVSLRPNLWAAPVAGEVMRDWFRHAIEDPDTLQSRADEGDFVAAIPVGSMPSGRGID